MPDLYEPFVTVTLEGWRAGEFRIGVLAPGGEQPRLELSECWLDPALGYCKFAVVLTFPKPAPEPELLSGLLIALVTLFAVAKKKTRRGGRQIARI